jgi:hypothetical protein
MFGSNIVCMRSDGEMETHGNYNWSWRSISSELISSDIIICDVWLVLQWKQIMFSLRSLHENIITNSGKRRAGGSWSTVQRLANNWADHFSWGPLLKTLHLHFITLRFGIDALKRKDTHNVADLLRWWIHWAIL